MKKTHFSIVSMLLIAMLYSVLSYAYLSDMDFHSGQLQVHQKAGKDISGQQLFFEESEFESDEKIQDLVQPVFFFLNPVLNFWFIGKIFLAGLSSLLFWEFIGFGRTQPRYLVLQVFRN